MRQGIKWAALALALCMTVPTLPAAEQHGSDRLTQSGSGPLPYYRNAALPNPKDLVRFDDAPVRAEQVVELSELGNSQAAFPAYYGALPVTPSSGRYDAPLQPEAAVPAAPSPSDFGATDSSRNGFVEYQEYLRKKDAGAAPMATEAVPHPIPSGSTVADPESKPTVSLAELGSGSPLEPVPLPPPPLPEIQERYGMQPDLTLIRSDFERLRNFCEADDLANATRLYAAMPNFGTNEELNHIRADSANLLILGMARIGNLPAARQIYESLPPRIQGFDASLAKARAIINLTTYYVRAERFNDAYSVLMDIGSIQNRSVLNNELFRLMARMIPYLDNAEETDKARAVYDLLLKEIKSPGTAALFAENIRPVVKYYLHFVDATDSPIRRRKRLDFLEHAFDSLEVMSANQDIALLRKQMGKYLAERYAGNPKKEEHFTIED